MPRKLLLIAVLGGGLNCLLLVAVALFGVTWGAPKPGWLRIAWVLVNRPVALDWFGRYFFWAAALNGATWAAGLFLLGHAIWRRLAATRAAS